MKVVFGVNGTITRTLTSHTSQIGTGTRFISLLHDLTSTRLPSESKQELSYLC